MVIYSFIDEVYIDFVKFLAENNIECKYTVNEYPYRKGRKLYAYVRIKNTGNNEQKELLFNWEKQNRIHISTIRFA
jgi:hypothetical protein